MFHILSVCGYVEFSLLPSLSLSLYIEEIVFVIISFTVHNSHTNTFIAFIIATYQLASIFLVNAIITSCSTSIFGQARRCRCLDDVAGSAGISGAQAGASAAATAAAANAAGAPVPVISFARRRWEWIDDGYGSSLLAG